MRKLFITWAFLAFAAISFAQNTTPLSTETFTSTQLFAKAHSQKKTAWLLLGGGLGMSMVGVTIGALQATHDVSAIFSGEDSYSDYVLPSVLMLGGGAAMISSIPVFISSAKNKHRAQLLLNSAKVQLTPDPRVSKTQFRFGIVFHI
jgi:hypothetical protein